MVVGKRIQMLLRTTTSIPPCAGQHRCSSVVPPSVCNPNKVRHHSGYHSTKRQIPMYQSPNGHSSPLPTQTHLSMTSWDDVSLEGRAGSWVSRHRLWLAMNQCSLLCLMDNVQRGVAPDGDEIRQYIYIYIYMHTLSRREREIASLFTITQRMNN